MEKTQLSNCSEASHQTRQYSLRSLILATTVVAILFAAMRVFRAPLYEFAFHGEWFGLPHYVFGRSLGAIFTVGLTMFLASVILFVVMIVQLARRRSRPFSAFVFLAYTVSWWVWAFTTHPRDAYFPPSILILISCSMLCLLEVVARRSWRQHWWAVAFVSTYTLGLWCLLLAAMKSASC